MINECLNIVNKTKNGCLVAKVILPPTPSHHMQVAIHSISGEYLPKAFISTVLTNNECRKT